MPGYIDSFPVPLHLPTVSSAPSKVSVKGKGKEQTQNNNIPALKTYDIVANWTIEEKDDVERRVAMAIKLGYSTIVLTISVYPTTNPASLIFPTPLFPLLDPRTAKPGARSNLILQLWKLEVKEYTEESVKSAGSKGVYGFANSTAALYPPSISILSVIPTCLPSFSHLALSISAPTPFSPTLITLDPSLSTRLPFPLKRGMISSLIRSGMMIELVYRGIMRQDLPEDGSNGGSSGIRRKNWIGGAREIVRAMGGKGIVLSSGALKAGEMRGTEDLINLCSLIGLTPSQAKDTLTINPQRAISRALALRQTYRGVLSNPVLIETKKEKVDLVFPGTKRGVDSMLEVEGEEEGDPLPGKKRKE